MLDEQNHVSVTKFN